MQCFKNPIFSAFLETEVSQVCDGRKLCKEKFQSYENHKETRENVDKFQDIDNSGDYF